MGVLRKIGRFFGNALRTFGNISNKVLSPMANIATAVQPLAPMLAAAGGPVGAIAGSVASLAPGYLDVAQKVSGAVGGIGNAITKASG